MASVEVRGLSKRYGSTQALEDVDLSVEDGEFFVVLGPSGAGKTTTLKSVAGLVDTDAGDVLIGGRSMNGVEPYHRNVAMAFESYALYPQKTVSQNLASPLRSGRSGTYSKSQQQQQIELVTTTLGINHLLDRFPRELSNGQRQRVALGRVLVRPADVYLLDEPLSHLDAKLRAAMRAELKQLGEMSSTTSVYVTHDYQEALALGDRVAVLRHGRVVQVATPDQVWHRPVDTFVAKALGQPEINLVEATMQDGQLTAAGGAIAVPVDGELGLSAGDRALVGIRPRDLAVAGSSAASPDANGDLSVGGDVLATRGTVTLAERLGREVEVTVRVGDTDLISVTNRAGVQEGAAVDVAVPLEHVHVFSAGAPGEETRRLGAPPEDRTPRDGQPARRSS